MLGCGFLGMTMFSGGFSAEPTSAICLALLAAVTVMFNSPLMPGIFGIACMKRSAFDAVVDPAGFIGGFMMLPPARKIR